MPSPSYDERLIAMFDSYCKEVSRNCIKDLVRKNERRGKYVSHEPVDYLLELLGHEDAYPSHAFTLEVDGQGSRHNALIGKTSQSASGWVSGRTTISSSWARNSVSSCGRVGSLRKPKSMYSMRYIRFYYL